MGGMQSLDVDDQANALSVGPHSRPLPGSLPKPLILSVQFWHSPPI